MKQVLIVDDSALARMIMRRSLAATGYLPNAAIRDSNDGVSGLEAIRATAPDLLLSDLNMPRLDGEGLLRAVRADPRLKGVFVLLCSSAMSPALAERLLALGANAVLVKPFTPHDLRAALAPAYGGVR